MEVKGLEANIFLGGCALGQHCKLSHEKLDTTDFAGTTYNRINGSPFGLAKEGQTNGRPYLEQNPGMGQSLGSGVSLGIGNDGRANGNDNRANGHTNYKLPIEMSAARRDWKQHKDAVIGKSRHEGPKARSVAEAPTFNLRDGGVALGASPSNTYDSSQARKVVDDRSTQYGHPIRPTPAVERADKAVGKSHKIDSGPHVSMHLHRKDLSSQNWPGNWQPTRPQFFAHRPVRDQSSMNRGSGPDLIPGAKSIGARNETVASTRLSGDVRDPSDVQARVIVHDPKFPTMTERQGEARLSLGTVHRAKLSSELPPHTNTKAPRGGHDEKRRQSQGLSHASPLPGDPGGGNNGKQVLAYGVGNGLTHTDLVQGLSEGARSELRGGGVALNDLRQMNHTPEKNGPVLIEADTSTKATISNKKVETNSSRRNSAQDQGISSQSSLTPSTLKPPKVTDDGEEIQHQFVSALRKIGRMDPRAKSWSPENSGRGSTGGSLAGGIRAGHSNLGATEVPSIDNTSFAIDRPTGNRHLGGEIPAESLGNRPAVGQQRSINRPSETAPWKSKILGFNEIGDSEGGAILGGIKHGEVGAKLQNVELEFNSSRANSVPSNGNQPVANGISNPLQGNAPPQGLKHPGGLPAIYIPGQNHYHSRDWAQKGHDWVNGATQSRGGHRSGSQGTGPRYGYQFGLGIEGNRHIAQHYQSLGYGHGVTAVPKNMIPASQFENRNAPLNASFMSNPIQTQFGQSQRGSNSRSDGRDFAHPRLDSTRFPQALSSRPTSDLSLIYRRQNLSQAPPHTLFSYESSLNSQGIQDDTESNRRSYTPEPEELNRSALKLYYDDYDERTVKENASSLSEDVCEGNL